MKIIKKGNTWCSRNVTVIKKATEIRREKRKRYTLTETGRRKETGGNLDEELNELRRNMKLN